MYYQVYLLLSCHLLSNFYNLTFTCQKNNVNFTGKVIYLAIENLQQSELVKININLEMSAKP